MLTLKAIRIMNACDAKQKSDDLAFKYWTGSNENNNKKKQTNKKQIRNIVR